MNWIPKLTGSTLSTIDLFAGYGGWSTAAGYLGLWVKEALNHWPHAIEVHSANHPLTAHYLGDVKETRPSQHPSTDLFMGSPTCTDFSQADPKNLLTLNGQRPLFEVDQREYERLVARHQGRATMFDVIEFIDHHRYHYGVIENVVEVHRWGLFDQWRRDLARAGYEYRFLYLNSMFFHSLNGIPAGIPPIPQSRDRWYCVFWRKGNPAPDLGFHPLAPCPNCGDMRAKQVWKNPAKRWGKYGLSHGQYYYGCPVCLERHNGHYRPLPVEPYYYAGINAIDWTIPIMRVDDPSRKPPISANTRRRIQAGLDKYGWEPLILDLQRTNGSAMKYRSALFPLYTQTKTASQTIAIPAILVDLSHTYGRDENHVREWDQPLPTQTTKGTQALALPPFLVELYGGGGNARPSTGPLNTVTAGGRKSALVIPPAFFTLNYGGREITGPMQALNTQTAHGYPNSLVLPPSFFTNNRFDNKQRSPDEPLPTMTTADGRVGLVLPFTLTYNGGHSVLAGFDHPLPTATTKTRHGFTWPKPTVNECYYRTIRSKIPKTGEHGTTHNESEIGRAMGFPIGPDGYKFDGSTDDITRGFGNAVTPGAGVWPLLKILEVMQ